MPSSPDLAPDSEFSNAEAVKLRSYKSASVIEVSPRPIELEKHQEGLPVQDPELATISTQPSEMLAEIESPVPPAKKRICYLWSIIIALSVATVPLVVLVAVEYWPEPKLPTSHMMVSDRIMFNSRLPNLLDLLELYSQKRVSLYYELGSPLEAIMFPNVQGLVLPKPQEMDPEVFKLITQVLEYIKPVSVVL